MSNVVIPSLILAVLLIASGPLFDGDVDHDDTGVVHSDTVDDITVDPYDSRCWDSDTIVPSYSEGIGSLP